MAETKQLSIHDLPIITADHNSPIPLYHQVETSLRGFIQAGLLKPGDVLPPEIELSHAYGVGRHTVRMALSRLTDDMLITRRAGRGTIVSQQSERIQFFLDRSFTRQMADMGRTARSHVLQTFTGTLDHSAPTPLRARMGAPYFYLMRLRFGDDEPIGLQKTILLTERFPNIEAFDFNHEALYDVLLQHYKLVIHEINHTISATVADDLKAELLQISEGDPLLVFNTAAYVDNGEIIEYTTSYYRADRYEYSTKDTFSPC
jgi:GntR family transcriptional regulator